MAEAQPPVSSGEEEPPKPDEQTTPAPSMQAEPAQAPASPGAASPPEPATATEPPAEQPASQTSDIPDISALSAGTESADAGADADDAKAIDDLLKQATFEEPSDVSQGLPPADNLELPNFNQVAQDVQTSSIDLLRDVDLNVKIELGRSHMLVEDVLKLGEGSVVELDKLAGDPVDVFVNDRLVARGEVLVLNDNFCVRVNEIVSGVKEEGL